MRGRRRTGVAWALLLACLVPAGTARAAGWGGITPGETTRQQVEAIYGRPTRERTVVEEARTVPEWTYTGERVPKGANRMVVSFGFFQGETFRTDIVRSVTLYANPGAFTLLALAEGWGAPVAEGTEEQTGRRILRYAGGLLAFVDKTGAWAEVLLFAPVRKP